MNSENNSTFFSFAGFIGGLLLSAIIVGFNYITSPTAQQGPVPFGTYFLICIGCGIVGGLLGERIVSKFWDWFSQLI